MKQPVVLRIYKADQLVGVKQFSDDQQIVIGRQGDIQVSLNDDRVSAIHAAIEERAGNYYLCDLGSETGTVKNNDTVLDAKLETGDIIKVGDHRIEFYIGVPKPKAPPQPAAAAPQPVAPPVAPPIVSAAALSMEAPTPPPQIPEPPKTLEAPAVATGGMTSQLKPRATPSAPRPRPQLKKEKKAKTFAPPSKYQSFRDFVKPSKGTVVEVLVLWKERVIDTYHFSGKTVVTMGSHPECNIVLPLMLSKQRRVPLLKIESQAIVMISTEYTGELIKGQQSSNFADLARQNRMIRDANGYALVLDQGEMIRIELSEQVSLIVRYTSDSPKPLAAPLFDLSASELAGVVMALAMVGILWLYAFLYSPPKGLGDDLSDEPLRTVKIELQKPIIPPAPVVQQEQPVATPPPTKATPVQVKQEDPKPAQQKAQNPDPKPDPGKAANLAPNQNKSPRAHGSIKQGGAVKKGPTEGAQAKSERDIKKAGVFSVFGGGGRQNEDANSYSGAGELSGMANAASGRAGQNENRAGEGLGSMKETGRGGTGTAAVGIAGGDPKGRGSGMSGYGTGGLGKRTGVSIVPGGNEESFSGSIDREAIRRVIQANLRSFRTCYERQLNRNPDLFGKVIIEWTLGEQGRVLSARTKSSEVGSDVAGCVRDIIRTLRFPEPPANQEVTVVYPFYFSN